MSRTITIRYSLARNLMLMILLTSGVILVVSYAWGSRVVEGLSQELIAQRIDQTERELEKFFLPVENALRLFRQWDEHGILETVDAAAVAGPNPGVDAGDPDSVRRLNARFVPLLDTIRNVSSMMIADTRGEEYLLLRMSDHWLNRVTEADAWGHRTFWMRREPDGSYGEPYWKDVDYDPRRRPWFQGALAEDDVHWTRPYRFFTTKDPGITASLRWDAHGRPGVQRVLGFDVMLIDISRFTTGLRVSANGMAMVVDQDGRVVGLPRDSRFTTVEELRANVLTPLEELEIPAIHDAVLAWKAFADKPGRAFDYRSGGETWWAGIRPVGIVDGSFQIAVAVPEHDFLGEVARQRNIVLATTGGALLAAFLLAVTLARRYSTPLAALAAQAERIQKLDLTRGEPIESDITEVSALAGNQDQMMAALDSFSRYVPSEVVRELLDLGEVASIGGRSANLTVLFTDIVGFTDIAERMDPRDLTIHLSGYFDAMLEILKSEHATVDKFMGDAIMAFWGAPVADPDQTERAMRAVLRCRRRVEELNRQWADAGRPELPTCFGLDRGPLVVGNVGAATRLNYTVLGDTVNLASRIEGLNRLYGTRALASQSVVDAAGAEFAWRLVDVVAVKGKTEVVRIHEPLGTAEEVAPAYVEFARAYEAAFECYRTGDFREALERLDELATLRPEDGPTRLLAKRCDAFIVTPPPADWDGVTRLEKK